MVDESTMPLTVLVAEDEPAMLSLVARHLRNLGFFVVEASEGDTAWELAQAHEPDLVVLDVMMPGMSGWEVCKRLKGPGHNGAFAKTGVIMLTGIGENLNDMTSPLFNADAWLNKPFDFADLDARVRETLERYEKPLPVAEGRGHEAEKSARSTHREAPPKAKVSSTKPKKKSGVAAASAPKAAAKGPKKAKAVSPGPATTAKKKKATKRLSDA